MKYYSQATVEGMSNEGAERYIGSFHTVDNRRKLFNHLLGFIVGTTADARLNSLEVAAAGAEIAAVLKRLRAAGDNRGLDLIACDAEDLIADISARIAVESDGCICFGDFADALTDALMQSGEDCRGRDTMTQFLGLCAGIVADGRITDGEVFALADFMARNGTALTSATAAALRALLTEVVEDGFVDAEEAERVREALAQIVGDGHALTGVTALETAATPSGGVAAASQIAFEGKRFAVTGPLHGYTRAQIKSLITAAGGKVTACVSRKTDYLIIGGVSANWKYQSFGNKIDDAVAHGTAVVPEALLTAALRDAGIE